MFARTFARTPMGKTNKRDVRIQSADHRRRTHLPLPPIEEIERELMRQLTPATFAQARAGHTHLNLRDRMLNLPTMCAIVLSLVYRQIASLGELLRVLEEEDLLWAEAMNVSKAALSKRFEKLPAALFASVFEQMVIAQRTRRSQRQLAQTAASEPTLEPTLAAIGSSDSMEALQKRYACVWIGDASTLEQLRKTTTALRQHEGAVLGGKMLMIVEAARHYPVEVFFDSYGRANEKCFNDQILGALPVNGLIILDAGFLSFPFFDALTEARKFFVTRMKTNIAYRSVEVLSQGPRYRDEIIELGQYRRSPCRHPVRMVSVLWGTTWYRYLTNELNAERLSAEQVAMLYRSRWRIEEAFLLTKRLLGLAYLWVGGSNGIQIQLYATVMFYAVLIELCNDVAEELKQPLDRISVEMVFRSLYHYSRAVARDPQTELVKYICAKPKLFGLVKAERKRHRERDAQLTDIWGSA
jgi:Transposase DDE domain